MADWNIGGTLENRQLEVGNWKSSTFHMDAATSTGIFAHAIQLTLGYI